MSRRDEDSPHRRRLGRKTKRTILIVGEGRETEPNYFHGLKQVQSVRDRYAATIKRGDGGSRVQIVKEAVNRKRDHGRQYDEAWCVFDTESLGSAEAIKDYQDAIALAKQNGIRAAVSNPSFEVWLLAHFARSSRQFLDGDAVIVELNKAWQRSFRCDYDKSDADVYAKLDHLKEAAIENARSVREKDHHGKADIAECNSSTEVHLLVERLLRGDDSQASA